MATPVEASTTVIRTAWTVVPGSSCEMEGEARRKQRRSGADRLFMAAPLVDADRRWFLPAPDLAGPVPSHHFLVGPGYSLRT